jgi:AAA15 family ATPase/GTPase
MLRSLRIENFRCFQTFELQQLGRVNLLVGTNNSGKTSILEAVQLFCSQNIFESLRGIMLNRGEYIWLGASGGSQELDIRHLFYKHEIKANSAFSIVGFDETNEERLTLSVEENNQSDISISEDVGALLLRIEHSNRKNENITIPLSINQGLATNLHRLRGEPKDIGVRTQYVTTSSVTTQELRDLFDQVVLTPEEDLVVESLQTIEPRIQRIASVGSGQYVSLNSPGGLVILLADSKQRIPLGSMGDGIRRILGLTLAIVNAKNGVLLVDEIDTGLHFSAMSDMWKLIWETAKRLNVQVFATTHSRDCWESLAAIATTESPSEKGITIQRIEKGKSASIVFTERQVVIAAEQGIEVR